MKAYLIDPFSECVTEVDYSGNYKDIYKLIKAELFDVVYINDKDCIYVDDEGLYKNNQAFFMIDGSHPLAGYGLVLGTDDDGASISPEASLQSIRDRVKFVEVDQRMFLE